jgi:hypothetical protein
MMQMSESLMNLSTGTPPTIFEKRRSRKEQFPTGKKQNQNFGTLTDIWNSNSVSLCIGIYHIEDCDGPRDIFQECSSQIKPKQTCKARMRAHELATCTANLGASRRQFRRSTKTCQWEVTLARNPAINVQLSVAINRVLY